MFLDITSVLAYMRVSTLTRIAPRVDVAGRQCFRHLPPHLPGAWITNMRYILVLWTFASLFVAAPALAGDAKFADRPVNCDALHVNDMICVQNDLPHDITAIRCEGSWGGVSKLSVPNGNIPSGGISIIDFIAKKRCTNKIILTDETGQEHIVLGFDVANNVSMQVKR